MAIHVVDGPCMQLVVVARPHHVVDGPCMQLVVVARPRGSRTDMRRTTMAEPPSVFSTTAVVSCTSRRRRRGSVQTRRLSSFVVSP